MNNKGDKKHFKKVALWFDFQKNAESWQNNYNSLDVVAGVVVEVVVDVVVDVVDVLVVLVPNKCKINQTKPECLLKW